MKKLLRKDGFKAVVACSLAVELFGGIFVVSNNYVFGSNMNDPMLIPTSYQTDTNIPEKVSEYEKADYKVIQNELSPCNNPNALSAEEAAEIGAQYLWDIFQTDLSGKAIYMSFTVDPSREIGYWNGDVYDNESAVNDITSLRDYSFSIEAISGKRNTAFMDSSKIDAAKTILYKESEAEMRFKDSIDECITLAKEVAQKQLPGDVVKAEFKSTGVQLPEGYEYEFEGPEGAATSVSAPNQEIPEQEIPELIKVPIDGEYEAAHVFINILVTDANGNQVEVEFDMASKSLITINEIYSGIEYDPNSIG